MGFLQWALSSVFVLGAVTWLCRSIFAHLLGRDLERYKADLTTTAAIETERLRSDLRRTAYEHEVTFERLHAERAEIVKTTHSLIVDVIFALDYLSFATADENNPTTKERLETAARVTDALHEYHTKNHIFLSLPLVGQISALIEQLQAAYVGMRVGITTHGVPGPRATPVNAPETRKRLQEAAKQLREILEKEFRSILGVTD